jgi:hypothetical protein
MLEKLHRYVTAVGKGEVLGDASVARSIENTLSLIPEQAAEFDNMFSKGASRVLFFLLLRLLSFVQLSCFVPLCRVFHSLILRFARCSHGLLSR